MKDWYLRQNARDRVIVLAVAALSIVGMLYAFVWYPISTGIDDNRTLVQSKTGTVKKMQVLAAQLKSLGGGSGVQLKDDQGKAPYTLIDEVIRNAGLGKPDRVEPRGANGARVNFSEVEFDQLVLVIAELELYGLSVDTLTIKRSNDKSGMVSARINMEKI